MTADLWREDLCESPVPVFIEKVLIPVGAVGLSYIIWTNPMNFDWIQRVSLGLSAVLLLFFLSYSLHLRNEVIRTGGAPRQTSAAPTVVQHAGDCSSNVAGDGNRSSVNCDEENNK
jgi:hypothetical protein